MLSTNLPSPLQVGPSQLDTCQLGVALLEVAEDLARLLVVALNLLKDCPLEMDINLGMYSLFRCVTFSLTY